MKAFFKELFDYNYHVNQKLTDVFNASADKTSEKAVKLFSHILNAQRVWNNRIDPRDPAFGVWDLHAIPDFRTIDQVNYEHTLHILDQLDLNGIVNYNIRGTAYSKRIPELLFHVINHSTYHRGQIATEFKQNGLEPVATDYILYGKA